IYAGGRLEGVPALDLIGGSNAYRRPGYSIAIEPGISYNANNLVVNFSVPFAVHRNRIQSYLDKVKSEAEGEYIIGDAAFADYLINLGITYRLKHKSHTPSPMIIGTEN
ncbi:MAG: transporter, partial [Saprospiraceae bacterium]